MAFNLVKRAQDLVPIRNVIISTYEKTGLAELVRGMAASCPGLHVYSTGGTYDFIAKVIADIDAGQVGEVELIKIGDYTGQGEMKGGLVKTLDWKIYLGILAEAGDADHAADLARSGAVAFDMVVANLYPFAEASADPAASPEALRQNIDIGGPSMLRAAAKNYLRVASVSSPEQYGAVVAQLRATGGRTRLETRRRLAAEAFALVSRFDAAVANRLGGLDAAVVASAYGLA
jgi:phosphoribosylaminoimidazolecarboxamide formyltransferase/IMP cyclohydrolase